MSEKDFEISLKTLAASAKEMTEREWAVRETKSKEASEAFATVINPFFDFIKEAFADNKHVSVKTSWGPNPETKTMGAVLTLKYGRIESTLTVAYDYWNTDYTISKVSNSENSTNWPVMPETSITEKKLRFYCLRLISEHFGFSREV